MARCPEPTRVIRREWNPLAIWGCVCALVIGFMLFVGGMAYEASLAPPPAKPDIATTSKGYAAAKLIQMGVIRWHIACAYQLGREGKTQKDALRQCNIDYGLGEPNDANVDQHLAPIHPEVDTE